VPTLKLPPAPNPPAHLQLATRKWFASVCADYALEEHHVRLLAVACEAWDRAQQARAALAEHGLTYTDRYGCPHQRPETQIERNSMVVFMRAIRELDLDVGSPAEASRPPQLRSIRR
jgi:phage terminase small subunit